MVGLSDKRIIQAKITLAQDMKKKCLSFYILGAAVTPFVAGNFIGIS